MESQESGSSSLEKSAMFEESQSAMSLQNVASETSSTMQETMVMTNMQGTKVTQEMHQEMHQEVHQEVHQERHLEMHQEMHREMLLSEEVEEVQVSSEERQETSWASSQSESSTCERSQTSSSMSLTERFAADSQQRYASTQETLRIPAEVETKKKEEAKVESGCILGKHMKVIKAAMEELELGEKKLEEQLDPSDTEHLHRRRQMSEQPSVISLDTTTISATNTGKESDEETIMTTTTLKDTTEWESTTCKETDDGDTTAKEIEDEGEEETETEDEETISMRKKIGAVFLTECSSSQVSLLKIFILVQILATILLLPQG